MLKQEFVKGTGEILEKIVLILENKGVKNRVMRGKKGPQAVETKNAVIVGKGYFWQDHGSAEKTVSVDRKIVRFCESEGKKLVFYVANPGVFVEFLPPVIIEKWWLNMRGDETFLNIDAGKYGKVVEDVSNIEKWEVAEQKRMEL